MGLTEAFTLEQAQRQFDINLFGVVRVNRAVLPHMRQRGRGLLVHVSSVLGRVVLPCFGIYCASKFALEALAETYRYDLSGQGIDSVLVEPGAYPTNIMNANPGPADEARTATYGEAAKIQEQMSTNLMEMFSSPEAPDSQEVADAIAALVAAPAGTRPLRTVVAREEGQGALALNEVAEEAQRGLLETFGMAHLLTLATPEEG